jgi:hypothetical protein
VVPFGCRRFLAFLPFHLTCQLYLLAVYMNFVVFFIFIVGFPCIQISYQLDIAMFLNCAALKIFKYYHTSRTVCICFLPTLFGINSTFCICKNSEVKVKYTSLFLSVRCRFQQPDLMLCTPLHTAQNLTCHCSANIYTLHWDGSWLLMGYFC